MMSGLPDGSLWRRPLMCRGWSALLLALAAGAAGAQPAQLVPDDVAKNNLACLTPEAADAPAIAYPANMLQRRDGGMVRVRLEFARPDRAPAVKILFSSAEDFERAIRERLDSYRLPCLPADAAPVAAIQEFIFDPRDGRPVYASGLATDIDVSDPCHIEGIKASSIRYPSWAMSRNEEGTVLVRSRFDAPGRPAEVKVLNDIGSPELESVASQAAARASLVCTEPFGAWPKTGIQPFGFRIEGKRQVFFRDATLRTFVALLKDLDAQHVRFDLSTMGCPFDVQLTLYRPYAANGVAEVGGRNPQRTVFLNWLKGLSLRIRPETEKFLLGSTMRISVPCGVLDLAS